jgi:hypothetical protein
MNDQSPPPLGHNNPPSPFVRASDVLAPFSAYLEEAENWLDGVPVESEDQLQAADALLLNVKAAEKALLLVREAATKPLHDAWKAEVGHWKAAVDELERLKKGLARISSDFKVRLADLREAEVRRIRADAEKRMRAAKELAQQVDPADMYSVRVADAARRDAEDTLRAARTVDKTRPKGIRTVRKWAFIADDGRRSALHWIARNDRDALTEFIDSYVARNFRNKEIDGVRVWGEREAY